MSFRRSNLRSSANSLARFRQFVPEGTQFPTLPHLSAALLRVAEIGELGITFGRL
jgi:hypothetical protein